MAKVAIVLILLLMSLVTLTVSATYYISTSLNHKEQTIPTATPNPTNPPQSTFSPTPTASPIPTSPPETSPYPTPEPTVVITPWFWNGSQFSNDNSSIVAITSPENDAVYNNDSLNFTVNVGTNLSFIQSVVYNADWLVNQNNTIFDSIESSQGNAYSITLTLDEIPVGNHNLTVIAYVVDDEGFYSSVSSSVNFTVTMGPFD